MRPTLTRNRLARLYRWVDQSQTLAARRERVARLAAFLDSVGFDPMAVSLP
jgi:hypothetical protein